MNKNELKKIWYGLLTHYIFLVPYAIIRIIVLLPVAVCKEIIYPILDSLNLRRLREGRAFYQDRYAYYKYKCEYKGGGKIND